MTEPTNMTSSRAPGSRLSPETQARLADRLASLRGKPASGAGIVPRATTGPAPLSPAQEALWLFEQMHAGTSTYVVPSARRMQGVFDAAALRRAFAAVVARHDALRTTIDETPDGPVQVVGESAQDMLAVEVRDLAVDGEGIDALLAADAQRPIDLRAGPAVRMTAYVDGDRDPVLLLVTHHLLVDGASLAIIWRDFATAYEQARRGEDPRLVPPSVQMPDVAVWERERLAAGALDAGRTYWSGQMKGAATSIEFPLDAPRADGAPAETVRTQLPAVSWDRVVTAARQQRATPFTVLAAVYAVLLFRWTGQNDVVIGVPVARRSRPELRDVVGYLANMLPLRVRVASDDTIADVIARVQAQTIAMFEHEDVPISTLSRASGTRSGGDALFATMFGFGDTAVDAVRQDGLRFEPVPIALEDAKCDLSVSVSREGEMLSAALEYRADIFARATVERAATWFETLLDAALGDAATSIGCLPMSPPDDRRVLLEEWGVAPARPATGTISAHVRASIAGRGDAIAIVDDEAQLSYRDLEGHIASTVASLREHGVGPRSVVGLVADRSAAAIVATLAILELGAAYVPIDPAYPVERVRATLTSAGAHVVVAGSDHGPSLAADFVVVAADDVLSTRSRRADAVLPPRPACDPDDPAVILFTSGSTGTPKGVVIPHRALVNHAAWMEGDVGVGADDVILHRAPLTFDVSVWETLGALSHGSRIVVARPGGHADAEYMVSAIAANAVTALQVTPTVAWSLLGEAAFAACRSLRLVLLGGEPATYDLVTRLGDVLPWATVVNGYGPTEATIDSTWTRVSRRADAAVPIGRPIRNATAYVLSPSLELQPIGVPGDLWIGGAGVATGYLGDPELTAARFVSDPFAAVPGRMYRTGDRARWRLDGQLEFLGRVDDQVKLRGVRLELGEVESALRMHPQVAAAAASIRADTGEQQLVAYYTTHSGAEIDADSLRATAAALLPPVGVPAIYVRLDALPRTVSGKVDRRALPAPPESTAAYVPPDGDVEAVVSDVWQTVLGVERISALADFFAIGGHSLLATRITARLNRLFGITIPLRRFFDAGTVRAVARLITEMEVEQGRARAVARAILRLRDMSPEQKAQLRTNAPGIPSRPASI